jgi:hypothetical protein
MQDGGGPNGLEALHFPLEVIDGFISCSDAHGGLDILEEMRAPFQQLPF